MTPPVTRHYGPIQREKQGKRPPEVVAKILGHVVDQARAHPANRETQLTFGEAVM